MCCTTLIAQPTTMVTTQLIDRACYDVYWPQQDEPKAEFGLLRMNWVVVTDENGNRQLRMRWRVERDG